jgi:glycosyltransferase involved in cell wall biosynthesis
MSDPVSPILLYHDDAYRSERPDLKGRHAAGDSFLAGFLAEAPAGDVFALCDAGNVFQGFADAVALAGRPLTARQVRRNDHAILRRQGLLHLPHPLVAGEARIRAAPGDDAYALCGVTHTIASRVALDSIAELTVAPVMPWDAIICTSQAVRQAMTVVIEAAEAHLRARVGATRFTRPRMPVIPLGIHTARFRHDPAERQRWRSQLGLADDAVAILFFGRLSVHAKASPFQLAQAAEMAAQRLSHPVAIVWCGWFANDDQQKAFMSVAKSMAPAVAFHHVDGRAADARFSIWSAADIFCSLSDNVQETFGLTVIEAMAASLPVIATDWDGYRDTIRHGVNGILVDSYFPESSFADLAFRYVSRTDTYDRFVGGLSQCCFADLDQTADWIVRLAGDAQLRRTLGAAARQTAHAQFDWHAILPRYRDLWADQVDALRAARDGEPSLSPSPSSSTTWKGIDPAAVFASYPARRLSGATRLTQGVHFRRWDDLVRAPGVIVNAAALLSAPEYRAVRNRFTGKGDHSVDELLAIMSPERHAIVLRSLYWMLKIGLLRLAGRDEPSEQQETNNHGILPS